MTVSLESSARASSQHTSSRPSGSSSATGTTSDGTFDSSYASTRSTTASTEATTTTSGSSKSESTDAWLTPPITPNKALLLELARKRRAFAEKQEVLSKERQALLSAQKRVFQEMVKAGKEVPHLNHPPKAPTTPSHRTLPSTTSSSSRSSTTSCSVSTSAATSTTSATSSSRSTSTTSDGSGRGTGSSSGSSSAIASSSSSGKTSTESSSSQRSSAVTGSSSSSSRTRTSSGGTSSTVPVQGPSSEERAAARAELLAKVKADSAAVEARLSALKLGKGVDQANAEAASAASAQAGLGDGTPPPGASAPAAATDRGLPPLPEDDVVGGPEQDTMSRLQTAGRASARMPPLGRPETRDAGSPAGSIRGAADGSSMAASDGADVRGFDGMEQVPLDGGFSMHSRRRPQRGRKSRAGSDSESEPRRSRYAGRDALATPDYMARLQREMVQLRRALLDQQGLLEELQHPRKAATAPGRRPLLEGPTGPPTAGDAGGPTGGQTPPYGLLPELGDDVEMKELHLRHVREMTRLRYQIEREQHLRLLEDLTGAASGGGPPHGGGDEYGVQEVEGPDNARLHSTTVSQPELAEEPRRQLLGSSEPAAAADAAVADAAPLQQELEEAQYHSEDSDDVGVDPGVQEANQILEVVVQNLGPLPLKGSYRIAVTLYDGFQPVDAASDDVVVRCMTSGRAVSHVTGKGSSGAGITLHWNERLLFAGVPLTPASLVVFEIYHLRPPIAGIPLREEVVAWAFASVLRDSQLVQGLQSIPLYRLPLMLTAARKFAFHHAMINFFLAAREGSPGDLARFQEEGAEVEAGALQAGDAAPKQTEDVAGVPVEAWCRVQRGIPPADPFQAGEGLVVAVVAARMLPGNCTVTKVVGRVLNSEQSELCEGFECPCLPESDALNPHYHHFATIGAGADHFEDPTATLVLQVLTVERDSGRTKLVGTCGINLFVDPREEQQPSSRNLRDYVLHQGSFQLPLHVAPPKPAPGWPLRGDSFQAVPRVACASLLVSVMRVDAAKSERRKQPPAYSDRVYDSSRDEPTPTERKMYGSLHMRAPLPVREAARLVAPLLNAAKMAAAQPPQQRPGQAAAAGRPAAAPAEQLGSLASRSDGEMMDWIRDILAVPESTPVEPLDYNRSNPYAPDRGFHVAVDAALHLPKPLPSAVILSVAPPGSFYQDNPVTEDVKVTLEYDLDSVLLGPRWIDGYQHFKGLLYDSGLCVILDVRMIMPSTGTTSPVGWACLPVFLPGSPFVASGCYHLPLFHGLPSHHLFEKLEGCSDVEEVLKAEMQAGRLRFAAEKTSVQVRLLDDSRWSQMVAPCHAPNQTLLIPRYVQEQPKLKEFMTRVPTGKTYNKLKPKNKAPEQFVEELNDAIMKVIGIDEAAELQSTPAAPPVAA